MMMATAADHVVGHLMYCGPDHIKWVQHIHCFDKDCVLPEWKHTSNRRVVMAKPLDFLHPQFDCSVDRAWAKAVTKALTLTSPHVDLGRVMVPTVSNSCWHTHRPRGSMTTPAIAFSRLGWDLLFRLCSNMSHMVAVAGMWLVWRYWLTQHLLMPRTRIHSTKLEGRI